MAAVFETEEPIDAVRIDGLAVLKIVKHCQESLPSLATGSLLGLTVQDNILEITHAFPFPEQPSTSTATSTDPATAAATESDAYALDGYQFQLEMMKMLREVNVDNNCVGWYQSISLGSYSTTSLLENQLSYQTNLSPNAVVVLYDAMQTSHGNLMLKCFRLSKETVKMMESGGGDGGTSSANNPFLDPRKIFEELPVTVQNPGLVKALLSSVQDGHYEHDGVDTTTTTHNATTTTTTNMMDGDYDTTFDRLDLSTNPYLEKHLEYLCTFVDDLAAEQGKFQYYTRGLNRASSTKYDKRQGGGKNAKNEEKAVDAAEAWESSDAPRRLESLLISNQIRNYCDQVDRFAGGGFGKLFLAGGLHKEDAGLRSKKK